MNNKMMLFGIIVVSVAMLTASSIAQNPAPGDSLNSSWINDLKGERLFIDNGNVRTYYLDYYDQDMEYEQLDYTHIDMGIIDGEWTGNYIIVKKTAEVNVPIDSFDPQASEIKEWWLEFKREEFVSDQQFHIDTMKEDNL